MAAERFREQLKRRAAMLAENGVDYAFDRKTPAPSGISGAGEAPSDLESIRTGMGDCRRCKLCEKRNTIVFGVGDPDRLFVQRMIAFFDTYLANS